MRYHETMTRPEMSTREAAELLGGVGRVMSLVNTDRLGAWKVRTPRGPAVRFHRLEVLAVMETGEG